MPKAKTGIETVELNHDEMGMVTEALDLIKGKFEKVRESAEGMKMTDTVATARKWENKIEDLKTKFLYSHDKAND